MARTLTQWVRELGSYDLEYSDTSYLIRLHNDLHKEFGDDPNEAILEGEQMLSKWLRSWGIEHRHDDALSVKAGTKVENPAPPTVGELRCYLEDILLEHGAISLVEAVEGDGTLYVKTSSVLPADMSKTLLRMINRKMPPGVQLKALPLTKKGDFASVSGIFDLKLAAGYSPRVITTWDTLTIMLRQSASQASTVFKSDQDPRIQFTVVKGTIDPEEQYVLGKVLEPDVIDTTKFDPNTQVAKGDKKVKETGAVGDTYDKDTIRKAFEWWCEYGNDFEYGHEVYGGHLLAKSDIILLDNFTAPCDMKIGDQEVKEGTWLSGAKIKNDKIWQEVKSGALNTWSVFARAMGHLEEVEVPA